MPTTRSAPTDLEDDWAVLRGDLSPRPEAAADAQTPHGGWEGFSEDLVHLSDELSVPRLSRGNLADLQGRLLILAIGGGLNPSNVPEAFWVGLPGRYREFAALIGYVPRTTPSSALGLRMLRLLTELQGSTRRTVAVELRVISSR